MTKTKNTKIKLIFLIIYYLLPLTYYESFSCLKIELVILIISLQLALKLQLAMKLCCILLAVTNRILKNKCIVAPNIDEEILEMQEKEVNTNKSLRKGNNVEGIITK